MQNRYDSEDYNKVNEDSRNRVTKSKGTCSETVENR